MTVFHFVLLCIACFRMTRLFVFDKITDFIRRPFHKIVEEEMEDGSIEEFIEVRGTGVRRFLGELLSCYWCTSLWCAILLYLGYTYFYFISFPIIIVLAIAGCASCIETILQRIIDE